MIVYRIARAKHSYKLIPPFMNNRWNSNQYQVLYASWSRSLACLENLVHKSGEMLSDDYCCMHIEIPDDVIIEEITLDSLPLDWKSPQSSACKVLGEAWINQSGSAVLRVPSSLIVEEFNFLINPAHPDFNRISIQAVSSFLFDPRLRKMN
ncbi:MAG: RES family NAD+ phosphorylase [Flavobacteriales bacterium]